MDFESCSQSLDDDLYSINDCYESSVFRSREQKVCLCWPSVTVSGWKSRNPAWEILEGIWTKSDRWRKLGAKVLPLRKDRTWSPKSPYFLYRLERKSHPLFSPFYHPPHLLLQELTSFQVSVHSLELLTNHCALPICQHSKAWWGHLSSSLPSMSLPGIVTLWGITMLLPNPQAPFVSSYPLSLCHQIPSHCLSLSPCSGTPNVPFQSVPCHQSFPWGKGWQAVTSPLWSLMCLCHRSPIPSHMVLCPGCHTPLLSVREELLKNAGFDHISMVGCGKHCFSTEFSLVIRHYQIKRADKLACK